jgi:APA family basic amino acid/polyamine antiporter
MQDALQAGAAAAPHQPELHRVMGPKLLLLFIVGDILGTGVYALTGCLGALPDRVPGRHHHRPVLS